MNYVHQALDVGPDEVVEVTLDNLAHVRLLDETNYEHYRSGREYHYHGGYATTTIYLIRPPCPGRWHLVIDLGGHAGRVRSWVRLLSARETVRAS
jgi:hypothetical protein